jgi:hypothetical protein
MMLFPCVVSLQKEKLRTVCVLLLEAVKNLVIKPVGLTNSMRM